MLIYDLDDLHKTCLWLAMYLQERKNVHVFAETLSDSFESYISDKGVSNVYREVMIDIVKEASRYCESAGEVLKDLMMEWITSIPQKELQDIFNEHQSDYHLYTMEEFKEKVKDGEINLDQLLQDCYSHDFNPDDTFVLDDWYYKTSDSIVYLIGDWTTSIIDSAIEENYVVNLLAEHEPK